MANVQDLKRRIRSITNTRKVTKAMKMVSAAKLRRAQERITHSRPHARRTLAILRSLAARANPELSPLLEDRGGSRVEVYVVTADRGMCGAFNAGILRVAEKFLRENSGNEVTVNAVGKKGREYLRRRGYSLRRNWADVFRNVEFGTAEEIGKDAIQRFNDKETDQIYLVYNEFKSAIQARPVVQRLLPIEPIHLTEGRTPEDYIYEPDAATLLHSLLPFYVEQIVFQAMIESVAAEHAARMTAMDSATNNAGELIDSLTLTMNRVRQASITTEIIEVVSGAQGLG